MSQFAEKLTRAGKILTLGFGDRVAVGILIGFLDGVSPDDLYSYLSQNRSRIDEVFDDMAEEELKQMRDYAHGLLSGPLPIDNILEGLRKQRIDLLSVIINYPSGRQWLQQELDKAIEKLK